METWLVYLRPKSSVAGWLSSDTLFGAICWALRRLDGAVALGNWLKRCQADPPQWLISSAFPFVDGDAPLHFLPMPLTLAPDSETVAEIAGDNRFNLLNTMRAAKNLGKAAYISEALFAQAVKGELTAKRLLEQILSKQVVQVGSCLLVKDEAQRLFPHRLRAIPSLWTKADVQHTAVDRVRLAAAEGLLFFDTEYFFAPRVGLFFLVRCPDDFPLKAVMRLWAHESIGGNRTVGKGHFEPTMQPADKWLAKLEASNGNAIILLSQCVPKPGEFHWEKSVYRLISKRPKFELAYEQPKRVHKGILRLIAEGSVLFPTQSTQFKPAYGRLLSVGEQQGWDVTVHPVFHDGLGFPLRMVMPDAME